MQNNKYFAAEAGIAIGPILFVVAILAVLVGALAAGSGGFSSSTADDSNRVNAGALIEQGTSIKNGIDRLLVNGYAVTDINLPTNYSTGSAAAALYSPTGGGLTQQSPPANVVPTTGVTSWRYTDNANLPSVGSSGANDFIVTIEVRSDAVCKAINSIIFGKTSTQATTVPGNVAAGVTLNDVGSCTDANVATTTAGCNLNANAFDISGVTGMAGRTQGCVTDGATTPKFYYYQLLTAG